MIHYVFLDLFLMEFLILYTIAVTMRHYSSTKSQGITTLELPVSRVIYIYISFSIVWFQFPVQVFYIQTCIHTHLIIQLTGANSELLQNPYWQILFIKFQLPVVANQITSGYISENLTLQERFTKDLQALKLIKFFKFP